MNAKQLANNLLEETGGDIRAAISALEDGAALAAMGVTDSDQGLVEDAHDILLKKESAKKKRNETIKRCQAGKKMFGGVRLDQDDFDVIDEAVTLAGGNKKMLILGAELVIKNLTR